MQRGKNGLQYYGIIAAECGARPEVRSMAKFKNPLKGVKVTYTRTHPLTRVVLIAFLTLSIITLLTLRFLSWQRTSQIEDMRQEAAALEAENDDLQEKIDGKDSVEGLEQIAGDELDLVDPDTIVIDPNP